MRTILGYTLSSKAAPFLGTKLRLDNAVMPENSGLLPLISSLNRYSLNSPYENSGLVLRRLDGVPFAGALQASPASSRGLTVGPGPRHPYGISSSDGSAQFSRSDLRKMSIPGRPQGE